MAESVKTLEFVGISVQKLENSLVIELRLHLQKESKAKYLLVAI